MQPRQSPYTSLSLRFNVHWTRASSRPPLAPRTALPPGMYIRPGRPDINGALQNAIAGVRSAYSTSRSRSRSSHEPSGIVIGSCGPTSLIDEATGAVGSVSWTQWNDVGGVESIEECVLGSFSLFGWFVSLSVFGFFFFFLVQQGIWVVMTWIIFLFLQSCRSTF